MLAALAPWVAGSAMVNFMGHYDAAAGGARRGYEPATYERLARIKRAYDPANLFRFNHNIAPAG
ncbi:BBE domain-containing protein [Asanoa siamensis]|uniref:Berberine/berberine-like domain-containing protein n=1 Tax=Asanoa siamensis TaxID=926357 RepID=A0ABQ4CJW8_9ACTN|nr:BBE domain-containing protein [Asanoa siamensis]GIF71574.1 hypothetical protein Asi02nite_10920 [Asanoa siamensis]